MKGVPHIPITPIPRYIDESMTYCFQNKQAGNDPSLSRPYGSKYAVGVDFEVRNL